MARRRSTWSPNERRRVEGVAESTGGPTGRSPSAVLLRLGARRRRIRQTRSVGMSELAPFDDAFRSRLRDLFVWRRDVRRFRRDPLPAGALERLSEIEIEQRKITIGGTYHLGTGFVGLGVAMTSDLNFARIFPQQVLNDVNLGLLTLRADADPEFAGSERHIPCAAKTAARRCGVPHLHQQASKLDRPGTPGRKNDGALAKWFSVVQIPSGAGPVCGQRVQLRGRS